MSLKYFFANNRTINVKTKFTLKEYDPATDTCITIFENLSKKEIQSIPAFKPSLIEVWAYNHYIEENTVTFFTIKEQEN